MKNIFSKPRRKIREREANEDHDFGADEVVDVHLLFGDGADDLVREDTGRRRAYH